jgi:hypothetical protein
MMLWKYKPLNQENTPGLPKETQQADFPPDATTTFSGLPTTGLVCK